MQILELERLGRRCGRRWALRGVTLIAEEGEMIAVWGGSGSGKTTLLHMLATLLRPTEGRGFVDGQDIRVHPSRVRSLVSLGFQTPTLDLALTLAEGLDLRATMSGVPKSHRPSRIFELLPLLGLDGLSDVTVGQLSTSQRRRAEVLAALLPLPRVLLLDEPFAGMDEATSNRLWDYLFGLRSSDRVTLVMTTSCADMAERCHRIAVLNAGRFIACDTPDLIRSAAGKDIVTVQPLDERLTARRLHERLEVTVTEEGTGFRLEVQRGERVAADILGSFGGQTSAIYVRRPSLEAGLRRIAEGGPELLVDDALVPAGEG